MLNIIIENFSKWIVIFLLLISLTFFQKYYYTILFFIRAKSPNILWKIINFIVRFWIILHEFSHVFFSFLAWHKIQEINLFSKNWWNVKYQYKNYIQSFWRWFFSFEYWILLILNQIWIFLAAIWPLIFWIILNYFFWNNLIWINFSFENFFLNYKFFLYELNWIKIFFITIYFILIPNFVLSWQDISHFIISRQKTKIATFVWSIINILIFIIFLFLFSLSFNFFILFCLWFFISFFVILFFWILVKIFSLIKK